jgi:DNA-binding MarR family transcriptional regulator
MTQTEIWQYLNVEAQKVTRTLTSLEKSGLKFIKKRKYKI